MKKLLILLLICGSILICLNAEAAVYTAIAVGGNWSSDVTWGGGGHPVAGDTANIDATMVGTVTIDGASACAILNCTGNGGTLAFGNNTLTCTGNVTLGGALTAGTGGLTITGASTMNSGGVTFPGKLTFNYAGNVTLSTNNWVNTGLVTLSAATNLNKTAAETLTTNGGLTMASNSGATPTATIIIGGTGGIWQGNYSLYNNLTFNCTTATISGDVGYRTGTLTYSSGTITTTGSSLYLYGACTLNTNGITWNNVYFWANATFILSSNLTATGAFSNRGYAVTMSGAFNISCASLQMGSSSSSTFKIVSGTILTVTTSLYISGDPVPYRNVNETLQAVTATSSFSLVYQGSIADCYVYNATFTDVDASGSAQGIDNWYGGTLTRTTNITNRTSADIGGGGGVGSISVSTNF